MCTEPHLSSGGKQISEARLIHWFLLCLNSCSLSLTPCRLLKPWVFFAHHLTSCHKLECRRTKEEGRLSPEHSLRGKKNPSFIQTISLFSFLFLPVPLPNFLSLEKDFLAAAQNDPLWYDMYCKWIFPGYSLTRITVQLPKGILERAFFLPNPRLALWVVSLTEFEGTDSEISIIGLSLCLMLRLIKSHGNAALFIQRIRL